MYVWYQEVHLSLKASNFFLLGNINMGGTNEPPALILITQVVKEPLSADVKAQAYRFPFLTQNLEHQGWNNTCSNLVHISWFRGNF